MSLASRAAGVGQPVETTPPRSGTRVALAAGMRHRQDPDHHAPAGAEPIARDRAQALIDVVLDELIDAFIPVDGRAGVADATRDRFPR